MTQNIFIKVSFFLFFLFVFVFSCRESPYVHGKILYENFCEQCHFENGEGLKNLIPPLVGSDYLEKQKKSLPCIIRYGMKGPVVVNGVTYNQEMTPSLKLKDSEITNVINYINSAWGNDYGYMTIVEVQEALKNCEK